MPEYKLLAICECKIKSKDEGDALRYLSREIEDLVTSAGGELDRLEVRKIGAAVITGGCA